MPRQYASDPTPATRSLRRRIARWQSGRVGRARMPEQLWHEALSVAEEVGVYRAAAVLDLNYSTLKRRFDARCQEEPGTSTDVPTFLEWLAPVGGGTVAECILEVESPKGTRLRLEMKGVPTQGLAAMLRDLVA